MTQDELFCEITKTSDLFDIQRYIDEVLKIRGFELQTAQDKMLLLTEEIGELAKSIRKTYTSLTVDLNKNYNYDTVESEVADVFIVLLSLCNNLQINLYNVFIAKEKENITRKWC